MAKIEANSVSHVTLHISKHLRKSKIIISWNKHEKIKVLGSIRLITDLKYTIAGGVGICRGEVESIRGS